MDMHDEDKGSFVQLSVTGRIDTSTAPLFEERLLGYLTSEGRSVLVDLTDVDFISSAGLRVFLMGAKKIKGSATKLVLCELSDNVRKVFDMSGFDRILDIQLTRADGEAQIVS